jgi:hypothetical protein
VKIRKIAKIVTFVALFSWLCASLFGLHSHIHLDGSPATLDSSFFKDVLDDSYGHKANPHVDTDSNTPPAKNLNLAVLLIAGLVILLLIQQSYARTTPTISFHPQTAQSLRPPLRAPPASLPA